MKIYVSGPFSSDPDGIFHNDKKIMEMNKSIARKIGIELAKLGHNPYVPHTHIGGWESELSYDEIMRVHLTFVRDWADALFFIGPSKGADIEKAEAEALGIPVFTSLEEVEEFTFSGQALCKPRVLQLPPLRLQSQFV
jgi:hypothetical protein